MYNPRLEYDACGVGMVCRIDNGASHRIIEQGFEILNNLAHQLAAYFPDLTDPAMQSALAVVHQRYSTNIFPSWDLAQPFRFLCHNGEINTLRGNLNWLKAREALMPLTEKHISPSSV